MTQKNSDRTIEAIARIGIDLAKDIFHVAAMDSRDRLLLQKRFTRSALLEFLGLIKPCLAGMEACAGAHHLAGKMQQMGFDARLMAPQFVKPYVKSNKNDRNDAEAICEAVARPTMRFVPLKDAAQLELQQIHRIRSMAVAERTAKVNQIRGFLLEFGIAIPQGRRVLMRELPVLLGRDDIDLSASMGLRIRQLLEELTRLESRILDLEREIVSWAQASADCKRLMTIPGVGPLGATVLSMKLGDAQPKFNNVNFSALQSYYFSISYRRAQNPCGTPFWHFRRLPEVELRMRWWRRLRRWSGWWGRCVRVGQGRGRCRLAWDSGVPICGYAANCHRCVGKRWCFGLPDPTCT